ncbi:hypothetical protein [Microbulbifer discodermiae]|uniref:hypothetical protein n=1 Tax=Microbulbifer sp. 2201CG32-9 TaxID=3232309 RepID=UPI00345B9D88
MRYVDGQEAILGDLVNLASNDGVVVCSIDRDEYTEGFTKEEWGYLEKGILINFQKLGLIHYTEPDKDLKLISRKVKS